MTFCQQIGVSSQTDDARGAALIAALERAQGEVKTGRAYIDALQLQVKSKQALIDKLGERDAAREQLEQSLEKEITDLRAAIREQKTALQIRIDEVDYLKKQLAKTQKKLNASRRREKLLVTAAAILAAILFTR